jgi:hypothetical protein
MKFDMDWLKFTNQHHAQTENPIPKDCPRLRNHDPGNSQPTIVHPQVSSQAQLMDK